MSSPTKTQPTIHLALATPADIPSLSHISHLAFKNDTQTALKSLVKEKNHGDDMVPALRSWISLSNERCVVLKAVASQGEAVVIAGWACWAFKGFSWAGELVAGEEVRKEEGQDGEEGEERGGKEGEQVKEKGKGKVKKQSAKISALESLTNSTMTSFSAFFSSPSSNPPEHMILVAITIRPSHQGKGVGSSLIRWGTSIADEKGVFCWVSSSDGGYRVFQQRGFSEVGRLGVCLDEFAEDGEGAKVRNPKSGDGMWGMYTWRWMRRDASPAKGGE